MASPTHDPYDSSSSSSDEESNRVEEDADAFLISIESKLRSNFSSLELCKTIQGRLLTRGNNMNMNMNMSMNMNSANPSNKNNKHHANQLFNDRSARRHLRLLSSSFEQMAKPIKLRVLISLMCLEPFHFSSTGKRYKLEKAIFHVISTAEEDDDEWVRILAGMIKGTMYVHLEEQEQEGKSEENETSSQEGQQQKQKQQQSQSQSQILINSCGKAANKLLEKTCNSILKDVQNHATTINAIAEDMAIEEEEDDDDNNDDDSNNNKNSNTQKKEENEIKIDRTVADLAPLFAPLRYTLLSPSQLQQILPESFDNDHFVTNEDVDLLKVDAEEERLNAEEERKELEQKLEQEKRLEEMKKKEEARKAQQLQQKQKQKQLGRSASSQVGGMKPLGRSMAGRSGSMAGRGAMTAGGRGRLVGRGNAVYGRGNMARGRGNLNLAGRGNRGLDGTGGGGSASFMRAPTRPTAAGKSGMLGNRGAMGRSAQSKSNTASSTLSTQRGGRAMKNPRSKMKMIDVTEVQDLNEEQKKNEEEERRQAKRRKIRENSGIKSNKGGWGGVAGGDPAASTSQKVEPKKQDSIPISNTTTTASEVENTSTMNTNNNNNNINNIHHDNSSDALNNNAPIMDAHTMEPSQPTMNNFAPQMNNHNDPNLFMVQQDNAIPELPPYGQSLLSEQPLGDPTVFHGGQLLHEQHEQQLHQMQLQQLQHEQQQQQQQQMQQIQYNQQMPFQQEPQMQHYQQHHLQQQDQHQQQAPMNDALMHLQPNSYQDQNMSFFDPSQTNHPSDPNRVQQRKGFAPIPSLEPLDGLQDSTPAPLQYHPEQPPEQPQPQPQQQQHQHQHQHQSNNMSNSNNWYQLLEKSNKITLQDRQRVEQFFTMQYNPTPEISLYKMKLHEEKKQMPDGSLVKETLYLELDYATFGFKKLKKSKNYG